MQYLCGEHNIEVFSDADWAGTGAEGYSTGGLIVFLGGGPVIYASRRQTAVALSTTEAVYIASSEAVRELVWLRQLLSEIGHHHPLPTLYIENKSTLRLIESTDTMKRIKHINLRYYVRHQLKEKQFQMKYIESEGQLADLLTKPLSGKRIRELAKKANILETSSREIMSPKSTQVLFLVGMVCVSMIPWSSSVLLEPHDALVWLKLEDNVQLGHKKTTIYHLPRSICTLDKSQDLDSYLGVKKTMYEGLQKGCLEIYKNEVVPEIEKFVECQNENAREGAMRREKRMIIDPISLSVIRAAINVSVGQTGALAYSYLDEDSSYNRLNKNDEVMKSMNTTMEKLAAELNTVKMNLLTAKEMREEMINTLSKIGANITTTRKAVGNIAVISPAVALSASQMYAMIQSEKHMWARMTRACKSDRISADDYAEMFHLNDLKGRKEADTLLDHVERGENGVLKLEFYSTVYSSDTSLYRLKSIPHWVNITSEPVLMKYTGPEFVMYNRTSNCTRQCSDPSKTPVYTHCRLQNQHESGLEKWMAVSNTDSEFETLKNPMVVKSAKESIIYCFYHYIIISGEKHSCPSHPFVLPISAPLVLNNVEHQVRVESITSRDKSVLFNTPHIEPDPHNNDYNMMARALKEKNDWSLEAGKLIVTREVVALPAMAFWILVIGCIFTAMSGAYLLHKFCRPNAALDPGTGGSREQINVITNISTSPKATGHVEEEEEEHRT